MRTGEPSRRPTRLLGEINLIPMVDTAFSLLIIFMITAPLLVRGIDIKLPQGATNTIRPEERKILTIEQGGRIFLDREELTIASLAARLGELKRQNPEISIYLKADREVPYGIVVAVMDTVKRIGVDRLGIVTEPIARTTEAGQGRR